MIHIRNRAWDVPIEDRKLGNRGERNVETKFFEIDRYTVDGDDLSESIISIRYLNSELATSASSAIRNLDVLTNSLKFEWLIDIGVTAVDGTIDVIVDAVFVDDDGQISDEWRSDICSEFYIGPTLESESTNITSDTYIGSSTRFLTSNDICTPNELLIFLGGET